MKSRFARIGLIGRHADAPIRDSMGALATHLAKRGIAVVAENGSGLGTGATELSAQSMGGAIDLLIAIGGDGTMLFATRLIAEYGVPLLGINRGRLGFLADIHPDDMLERVDEVLGGEFDAEDRLLLEAEIISPAGKPLRSLALNDVVLQKWDVGRMLEFETWVEDTYVNTHGGDGLIVATATGSTAYALSCGGPILSPDLDAIALVPICPHTLSDRPIAIPSKRSIEIRILDRPETKAQVTCDGLLLGDFAAGQTLRVRAAPHRQALLHPRGHDYYKTLRSKLHWGRGEQRRRSTDE